jgi:hypothetical protein
MNERCEAKMTPLALSSRLLHQCRLVLAELDAMYAAVVTRLRKQRQQQNPVEMRLLRSSVLSELKTLEKLHAEAVTMAEQRQREEEEKTRDDERNGKDTDHDERRLIHTLRSSNLPFYVAVWTIAKERCRGVVAFSKRFSWDDYANQSHGSKANKKLSDKERRRTVLVDIVSDDGEEWVKVSTITESRLLFEMAEKGWERGGDEEEVPHNSGSDADSRIPDARQERVILRNSDTDSEDDEDDQIELIRLASDLIKAAHATRIRYRHPRVRLVFSRLLENRIPEIDHILREIQNYGIIVECGLKVPDVINDEMPVDRDPAAVTSEDLPLETLLPNPFAKFTTTINIDCTLLLAIVSDLSNIRHIAPSPNYHPAIVKQIEVEDEQPLLPAEIWPAMVGRRLVCTKEAVKRMRDIVDTIGTEAEKKRTAIILSDSGVGRRELLQRIQQLSDHQVPDEWLLPIKVVDVREKITGGWRQGVLPVVAHSVAEILSDINRSVFFYGWAEGITTITSNKTVVKQIHSIIEDNRNGDDDLEGPRVWVCDTARSLVGKEKNRIP